MTSHVTQVGAPDPELRTSPIFEECDEDSSPELERRTPGRIASESEEFPPDTEMQQSSLHGAGKDDELKRIVRQHPQKGIPQIEGIEPENAPFKE
jgi:hypothetical protein